MDHIKHYSSRACAHRGDCKIAPENTIPAIQLAVQKGAHQIEFDVTLSRDGELVIMHDSTVDRTTDGTGAVTALTFKELRALDAGSWKSPDYAGTRIPTFCEVLEAATPPVLLNCHLREVQGLAEKVTQEIVALDRVDQCFLACNSAQVKEARAVCSDIAICYMDGQGPPHTDYPQRAIDFGAEYLQIWGWHDCMTKVVQRLHDAGVRVNYFGTEDPGMMRKLIEANVDYILTDDLDTLLAVLREYDVEPLHH
ncbi:MAG: glycerophosphodiester phosphodiesterase [Candidatus Zipacnadales bacterium]